MGAVSRPDAAPLPERVLTTLQGLRRFPDVEDPTLRAWDATDELLLREGLDEIRRRGLSGPDVAVLGERHGALTLGLASAGVTGVRVLQDRLVHERALAANAAALGLAHTWEQIAATPEALEGARLLLWQLPRAVDAVARQVALLSRVAPDALLIAGGRVKHLSTGMNTPLSAGFGEVHPQLAERKSRLLRVQRDAGRGLPAPSSATATVHVAGHRLSLVGIGEAFGGAALDPGTRLLLESLIAEGTAPEPGDVVVDLGCGNGTVAAWAGLAWPGTRIEATDDSSDAVASAAATIGATLGADRLVDAASLPQPGQLRVVRADAGDHLAAGSADLVLLNPPFHQGGTVHVGIGVKLIQAAACLLRPGGRLVTVYNSHLQHRGRLGSIVGPTRQVARNRTFTVTVSTRRG